MLKKGLLNVVTGSPSSGKSELLDQLMLQTIALHDWHWTVFSPENWPIENHFQKLAEKWEGRPLFGWPDMPGLDSTNIALTISDLSQNIHFIDPPEDDLTIEPILEALRESVREHKTDAFILDPWNELEHNRPHNMSETEYIGQALTKLRNFARRNNVDVFLVAHPTKLQKDDDGNYPVPTPYDISGSSNWFNKADMCWSVWRNYTANDGVVQVHIQKVRNKNLGQLGMAQLFWHRATGLFLDERVGNDKLNGHAIKLRVQ